MFQGIVSFRAAAAPDGPPRTAPRAGGLPARGVGPFTALPALPPAPADETDETNVAVPPNPGRLHIQPLVTGLSIMQVQVNADRGLTAQDVPSADVRAAIETAVARFSHRITRVEVHLSDQNSHKRGRNDKRCVIEARLAGLDPVAVTHEADTSRLAIDGAVGKLERSLEKIVGRLNSP